MTSNLENSLVFMALAKDFAQMKTLLSASKETQSEELIQLLLTTATKSSHLDTVNFLLDQYPSVTLTEEIVRAAINTGSIEIVKTLLTHNPSIINMQFDRRGTPLIIACMGHQPPEFLRFLLEAGADPNQDPDAATFPLALVAALYSDPAVIDLLLEYGASLKHSEALSAAARRGNEVMLLHLLRCGASPGNDVEVKRLGFNYSSPLHIAVKCNRLGVVKILLRYGVDPTVADASGVSPIEVAEKMEVDGKEVSEMLEILKECRNSK